MNGQKKWGAFRVQLRGQKKWTTLSHGFWFGDGYELTRDQAQEKADEFRQGLQSRYPHNEYRVSER